MGKGAKTRKKSARSRRTSVAKTRSKSAQTEQQTRDETSASERFVNDLRVRGEAAKLTPEGKLPLSSTHVIEKENDDGSVEVKRVRYKLF